MAQDRYINFRLFAAYLYMSHDKNHRIDVRDEQGDNTDYPPPGSMLSHDALFLSVDRKIIVHSRRVIAS